ncbi:hypothetical protein LTR53_005404 [Teratosphaeriaceae sp. CCFEE 6253]|nr:hypothetical protein LTR53_005404 [Teratosphaeriaceae sp. CCFEE 6253]
MRSIVPRHIHPRAETPLQPTSTLPSGGSTPTSLQALSSEIDNLQAEILRSEEQLAALRSSVDNLVSTSNTLTANPLPEITGQATSSLVSAAATATASSGCVTSGIYMTGACASVYDPSTTPADPATTITPTASPIPAGPPPTSHANRTRYKFNPQASDNVAVYYGQTPNTTAAGLGELCRNPNVDLVLLAFVTAFFAAHDQPRVNFGAACDAPSAAQLASAPDLLDCPRLAADIKSCQRLGKPVLVSLGGYIASTSLSSTAQAKRLAATLWDLFGAGTATPDLRPFRDAVVDGFDFDNESGHPAFYNTLATALRTHMAKDPGKRYYISAAPQCPIPDASLPLRLLRSADFVWVQFYNNPACNLDSEGFAAAFEAWVALLRGGSGSGSGDGKGRRKKPRVYIGAGSFEGAGSGYVPGVELPGRVAQVKEGVGGGRLGGMMLWDGLAGVGNVDESGMGYLHYAKGAVAG